MKKILFIAAVSGSLLTGCDTSNFTVNGTIEGVTEGLVYLTALNETGEFDTLATAAIANQKFTLKGQVEGIRYAALGVANSSFLLFLEEGKYTATITSDGEKEGIFNADIEGGDAQRVFKQFNAIQQEFSLKMQELSTALFASEDPGTRDSIQRIFLDFQAGIEVREDEVIKANPDAEATAFFIYYNRALGMSSIESLKALYNQLGDKGKATKYGKLIEEQMLRLESVAVGQTAPDFKLVTPAGDSISLYGIEAKIKLIDFWASWCGPCRAENPNVLAAYADYHPKGLEILGVSLDTERDNWLKALADDQLTWKQSLDATGVTARLYGVTSIPHTLLLDANNKIIAKNLRGDELKAKLAELLD